ncbi:MAG: CRISPR-associated protein [Leptolyngbya sp. SIO3F4]|nr:CRISPR-associated protein [Leptolyngbya sp. SIO3F4]
MTNTPRPQPRSANPPSPPRRRGNFSDESLPPKPYEFVSFPSKRPPLKHPAGHQKYLDNRLHGKLSLSLKVETPVHISTGAIVMGKDIGDRLPLIKPMVQGSDQHLTLQGSSIKGCIRAVYEAITNSTLAVVTSRYRNKVPTERLPCRDKKKLCPASQIFGALDWQGLVEFSDARCTGSDFKVGFMPSLYRPRPDQRRAYFLRGRVAGRKFYYHTKRAINRGQNKGIATQQAGKAYQFTTQLTFKNLTKAELGTLLVTLGQDPKQSIALKVGGGKPIGMGTMTVTVDALERVEGNQLRERYMSYQAHENTVLTGEKLQEFIKQAIQSAHKNLIEASQLKQLSDVLGYPTDREPPSGMY